MSEIAASQSARSHLSLRPRSDEAISCETSEERSSGTGLLRRDAPRNDQGVLSTQTCPHQQSRPTTAVASRRGRPALYATACASIRSRCTDRPADQMGRLIACLGIYYCCPAPLAPRRDQPDRPSCCRSPTSVSISSISNSGRRTSTTYRPSDHGFGRPVLVTSLFGRVWCGFTCPQTSGRLFMWVERVIEGDRNERMKRDAARSPRQRLAQDTQARVWLGIAFWTGGAGSCTTSMRRP